MRAIKWILLIAVVLYVVSPIDFMPGPIDDIIVAIMGIVVSRKISLSNPE